MKIRYTSQARLDLFDIWNYIANDSVDAADRMRDKFDAVAQKSQSIR